MLSKAIDESETKDERVKYVDKKFRYVIAKIANQNAKNLLDERELV